MVGEAGRVFLDEVPDRLVITAMDTRKVYRFEKEAITKPNGCTNYDHQTNEHYVMIAAKRILGPGFRIAGDAAENGQGEDASCVRGGPF